jgi:hypothetical protein
MGAQTSCLPVAWALNLHPSQWLRELQQTGCLRSQQNWNHTVNKQSL